MEERRTKRKRKPQLEDLLSGKRGDGSLYINANNKIKAILTDPNSPWPQGKRLRLSDDSKVLSRDVSSSTNSSDESTSQSNTSANETLGSRTDDGNEDGQNGTRKISDIVMGYYSSLFRSPWIPLRFRSSRDSVTISGADESQDGVETDGANREHPGQLAYEYASDQTSIYSSLANDLGSEVSQEGRRDTMTEHCSRQDIPLSQESSLGLDSPSIGTKAVLESSDEPAGENHKLPLGGEETAFEVPRALHQPPSLSKEPPRQRGSTRIASKIYQQPTAQPSTRESECQRHRSSPVPSDLESLVSEPDWGSNRYPELRNRAIILFLKSLDEKDDKFRTAAAVTLDTASDVDAASAKYVERLRLKKFQLKQAREVKAAGGMTVMITHQIKVGYEYRGKKNTKPHKFVVVQDSSFELLWGHKTIGDLRILTKAAEDDRLFKITKKNRGKMTKTEREEFDKHHAERQRMADANEAAFAEEAAHEDFAVTDSQEDDENSQEHGSEGGSQNTGSTQQEESR
ncbi:hypothetical protein ACEPPN_009506 [Leptodophora sp. 'Broadleaf-Isolate-01']